VTQAGPDALFGTADDILTIAPQQSGNAEHLVEGLREGTHTVLVKISALLDLPIGPVKISGSAVGTIEVRNPTFALTLSHPATITAGEEYDLLVTVTNTSESPANFVSLSLPRKAFRSRPSPPAIRKRSRSICSRSGQEPWWRRRSPPRAFPASSS
jgi:hypothetical protein